MNASATARGVESVGFPANHEDLAAAVSELVVDGRDSV